MLAGTSGLGYIGYTHKCQLFPSLCQNVTPKAVLVKHPLPTPGQSTISEGLPKREPKSVAYPEKSRENLTQVVDSLSQLRQSFTVDKSGIKRAVVVSDEEATTTRPKGERRETAPKAIKQPKKPTRTKLRPVNEESELEKALNKPL